MSERVRNQITFAIEVPNNRSRRPAPTIETLLTDAPKTEDDWQKRRMDLELSEPISIIRTFLRVVNAADTNARDQTSKAEGLLQAYQTLLQTQNWVTQKKNFITLIYWCLCRIISITRKLPVSTINNYMKNVCLQDQAKPETKPKGSPSFQKDRTSILWATRMEQALRPLIGNRANEFFLLWAPPVSMYRALWDQDTPQRNEELVAMVVKSCARGGQDCTISFSLPFLVTLIGRGLFKISDVNEAFETELSEDEFKASIYNISLQVHRISGFSQPMLGAQDTPPEDCESRQSVRQQEKNQSLAYIIADFFRRLRPIAIGMLEGHHNASRGNEAHALNYNKTNLFVGAGDGDGKNLQETRISKPINDDQDGGQTTSLPTIDRGGRSEPVITLLPGSDTRDRSQPRPKGFQNAVDAPQGNRALESSSDAATPSQQDSSLTVLSVNTRTNSSFLSLVMNTIETEVSTRGMGIPPSLSLPPVLQPQSWLNDQTHTLNHNNANFGAFVGDDGAERASQRVTWVPVCQQARGEPRTPDPFHSLATTAGQIWDGIGRSDQCNTSDQRKSTSPDVQTIHEA